VKSLLRQISHYCVVCQKAYARCAVQKIGLLPAERVRPSPPFAVTGMHYAGSVIIAKAILRSHFLSKLMLLCFITRAIHLNLVSELTFQALLAALNRFTDRHCYPTTFITDHGTTFLVAQQELKYLQKLLTSQSTQNRIHIFTTAHSIKWKIFHSR